MRSGFERILVRRLADAFVGRCERLIKGNTTVNH